MKRIIIALMVLALQFLQSTATGVCPYEADIILDGSDYTAISGIRTSESRGWVIDSGVIYTFWENEWIEYTAYLTEGTWRIGICAINYSHPGHDGLGTDPSWYPQFELSNSLTDDILVVPASDTTINSGYFCYEVLSDGLYNVRFTWLNDKAEGERPDGVPVLDANIKIVRVFFEEGICDMMIDIDIMPGGFPNSINLRNKQGVTPVALLGSEDFDVTDVDLSTIMFEGVSPLQWAIEDVPTEENPDFDPDNPDSPELIGDGHDDLIFHFSTPALRADNGGGLDGSSTEATLTGETLEGMPIDGTDSVNIIAY